MPKPSDPGENPPDPDSGSGILLLRAKGHADTACVVKSIRKSIRRKGCGSSPLRMDSSRFLQNSKFNALNRRETHAWERTSRKRVGFNPGRAVFDNQRKKDGKRLSASGRFSACCLGGTAHAGWVGVSKEGKEGKRWRPKRRTTGGPVRTARPDRLFALLGWPKDPRPYPPKRCDPLPAHNLGGPASKQPGRFAPPGRW